MARIRRVIERRLLLSLLVMGTFGAIAGVGAYSSFTSTTSNTGNSFAAGSVVLGDNDSNTAMLSLTNAKPGVSDTSCIKVTYTGSLSSTVRLYGTLSGTLASYLTLTVTRGTDSSPSFDSCTNFTADATNYNGNGAGVIYTGNLSAFPSSYAAGIVDPTSGSPATWTNGNAH